MSRWWSRMRGAALLHADTYEEVEADVGAMRQALAIVLVASVSNAAGTGLAIAANHAGEGRLAFQVAVSALIPLVVWLGGSTFSYMAGATFFRTAETQTDIPEVLRTTGFAFTPGVLLGLAATPPLMVGVTIAWLVRVWILVAAVIAIRQALDFTTPRAVGTFGTSALLLWLLIWGLAAAPLPL